MAETLYVRKNQFNKLEPTDANSEEILEGLPTGQHLKAVITKPRNIKFHRKFFAMLKIFLENQEYFENVDDLRYAVQMKLKMGKWIKINDAVGFKADSLSFSKMDELAFNKVYERAYKFLSTEVAVMDRELYDQEMQGF